MINRADVIIKRSVQVARNVILGTSSGGGVGGAGVVTTSPVPPGSSTTQNPTTGADVHVALYDIDSYDDPNAVYYIPPPKA